MKLPIVTQVSGSDLLIIEYNFKHTVRRSFVKIVNRYTRPCDVNLDAVRMLTYSAGVSDNTRADRAVRHHGRHAVNFNGNTILRYRNLTQHTANPM